MRNMSFSLTTDQIRDKSKTVTRRVGWEKLVAGELVRPVVKAMGLKKGEKVEPIRGPLRVLDVRREELNDMVDEPGATAKEGFPDLAPTALVDMFCKHMKVYPDTIVTRIEFGYTD